MKTHKITEFNLLPDRRVEQKDYVNPVIRFPGTQYDNRTNKFTYPSDKLIIEVPLDEQPERVGGRFQSFKDYFVFKPWNVDDHLHEQIFLCHYQKDDILALGEDYLDMIGTEIGPQFYIKRSEWAEKDDEYLDWEPASTCPIEICRKVKVHKVDIQEREVRGFYDYHGTFKPYQAMDIEVGKIWHLIILVEKI